MTKEEWKEVEGKLKSFYCIVKLRCDEYEISLVIVRISQFKNEIQIYVNGVVKGEWLNKECEESKRFLRKVSKSLYSQKHKLSYKKLSKRMQKEIGLDIDKTYSYYLPSWTSFNSLKRQLIRENNSIELIQEAE